MRLLANAITLTDAFREAGGGGFSGSLADEAGGPDLLPRGGNP